MKIYKYRCNQCNSEVDDVQDHVGWITISSGKGSILSITGGRNASGQASSFRGFSITDIHLCSVKCLLIFIYLPAPHVEYSVELINEIVDKGSYFSGENADDIQTVLKQINKCLGVL